MGGTQTRTYIQTLAQCLPEIEDEAATTGSRGAHASKALKAVTPICTEPLKPATVTLHSGMLLKPWEGYPCSKSPVPNLSVVPSAISTMPIPRRWVDLITASINGSKLGSS